MLEKNHEAFHLKHNYKPYTLVLDRFYHWEKTSPKKVYLTQPAEGKVTSYTFQKVGDQVRKMAQHLINLDLPPLTNIAIFSKNCAHWIMADLAIWMAGHVSVPLYPTLSPEAMRQILEHSEARVLFIGKLDGWDKLSPEVPTNIHKIALPLAIDSSLKKWVDIIQKTPALANSPQPLAETLATIIYTSGTTGNPKGVMHCFGAMAAAACSVSMLFRVTQKDRMMSYLPLSHVAERMCIEIMSLHEGIQIFFSDNLDTFLQDLNRAKPTLFFAVPRIWVKFQLGILEKIPQNRLALMLKVPVLSRLIAKKIREKLGLGHVRYAFSGAAPLPIDIMSWYRTIRINILEVYGMTENFGYSHCSRPGFERLGYVGQANPAVVTKIDALGEILVFSPATMMGYFKEPEKTKKTFNDEGFLKTGDVGEIDSEGRLKITGRVKEIFKSSKGKYIAPSPIENKILALEWIEQVCVVGEQMPQPIALLNLSIQAQKMNAADIERLLVQAKKQVNKTLEAHERIQSWVVVRETWGMENGFVTPTLKLKRNVLEKHYQKWIEQWSKNKDDIIWQ